MVGGYWTKQDLEHAVARRVQEGDYAAATHLLSVLCVMEDEGVETTQGLAARVLSDSK